MFLGSPAAVKVLDLNGDMALVMHKALGTRAMIHLDQLRCVGYSSVHYPPHVRHFSYVTPLHIAVEYMHIGVIQALLEKGADPNSDWNYGRNFPLHTSIWQGHYKASHMLLQHGADANAEDSWGRSPLATAAICPKQTPRFVGIMLLEAGAERLATDNCGKTAAQLARECENEEIAAVLESYQLGETKRNQILEPIQFPDQGIPLKFTDAGSDVRTRTPSEALTAANEQSFPEANIGTPPDMELPGRLSERAGSCGGGDPFMPPLVREEDPPFSNALGKPLTLESSLGIPPLASPPAPQPSRRDFVTQSMPAGIGQPPATGGRHSELGAALGHVGLGPGGAREFGTPLQSRNPELVTGPGPFPNGFSPEFSAQPLGPAVYPGRGGPEFSALPHRAEQDHRANPNDWDAFPHPLGNMPSLPERAPSRQMLPPLQGGLTGSLPPLEGTMPRSTTIPALPKTLPKSGHFTPIARGPPVMGSRAGSAAGSNVGVNAGGSTAGSSVGPLSPPRQGAANSSSGPLPPPRQNQQGSLAGIPHRGSGPGKEEGDPGHSTSGADSLPPDPGGQGQQDVLRGRRPPELITDHTAPGTLEFVGQSPVGSIPKLSPLESLKTAKARHSPRASSSEASNRTVKTMSPSEYDAVEKAAKAVCSSQPPDTVRTVADPQPPDTVRTERTAAADSQPPDTVRTVADPPDHSLQLKEEMAAFRGRRARSHDSAAEARAVLLEASADALTLADEAPATAREEVVKPRGRAELAAVQFGASKESERAGGKVRRPRSHDSAAEAMAVLLEASADAPTLADEALATAREEAPAREEESEHAGGKVRRPRSHDSAAEAMAVLLEASADAPTLADEALATAREEVPDVAQQGKVAEPSPRLGFGGTLFGATLSEACEDLSPLSGTLRRTKMITPPRPGPFALNPIQRSSPVNANSFAPGSTCPPAMLRELTLSMKPRTPMQMQRPRTRSPDRLGEEETIHLRSESPRTWKVKERSKSPLSTEASVSNGFNSTGKLIAVRPSRSPAVSPPPTAPPLAEEAANESFKPLTSTSPALSRILTPSRPGAFAAPTDENLNMTMTGRWNLADSFSAYNHPALLCRADSIMGADSESEFGGSPSEVAVGRDTMLRAVDVGSDNESWESV